ncbi:hypothetical protein LBMAG41_13210 [Cyanobium sp.]|nr:hypothetical protein LBMAG41_13210 [Cyanobium sp.]
MPTFGKQEVCGPGGGPLPVTLEGGGITLGTINVPSSVTVGNTDAAPIPIKDGGNSITVDDGGGSMTVDGPLTNVELRAEAVPVTGGLTNAELRADAVPVTGGLTNAELRADAVPVTGGLTNAELRATPVPVVASAPTRTPTTTSVLSTTTSVLILAANASRRGLMISNQSTNKLYLSLTTPALPNNSFIEVAPSGFLLLDQQTIFPNAIYGIWSNAQGTAQVTEFV